MFVGLATTILTLVLCFLALEVALRRIYHPIDVKLWDFRKFELIEDWNTPYLYRHVQNFKGKSINVECSFNRFSFRRAGEVPEKPSPGVYRVLVYGDSIGQGVGVQDDQTFESQTEDCLNQGKEPKPFEVLNMVRGTAPTIYSFHIRRDIQQFSPQMIVMEIEVWNDVGDEVFIATQGADENGLPTRIDASRYAIGTEGELLAVLPIGSPWLERRIAYSFLSQKIGALISRNFPNDIKQFNVFHYSRGYDDFLFTKERLSQAYDRMFLAISGVQRLCKKHGIQFVLLILPSRFLYENGPERPYLSRLVERAERSAGASDVQHINLTDSFRAHGGRTLFLDVCHPNADGYRVIAQSLCEYIGKTEAPRVGVSNP